jgi:TPR repeat protein
MNNQSTNATTIPTTPTTASSSLPTHPEPSITLPLLYFDQKGGTPLRVIRSEWNDKKNEEDTTTSSMIELPSELLYRCLISYANLGDLAKYTTLQTSWCSLLTDVTNMSYDMKWYVATSYLMGQNGLSRVPRKAMQLFLELASASSRIDNDIINNNNNDRCMHHPYFVPAMKKIAHLYLEGTMTTTSHDDSESNNTTTDENDTVCHSHKDDDDTSSSYSDEIEQDIAQGLQWLEKCYAIGHDAQSAYELALIYEYGKYNVTIDVVVAFDYFHKAALLNHVDAMAEIGLCYELGLCGVEQNDTLALDWYMKAAELGHSNAKYSIGEAFEEARGVPQSDAEACLWYYKAAMENDCEDSKRALKRLQDIARIVIPGYVRNLSNV